MRKLVGFLVLTTLTGCSMTPLNKNSAKGRALTVPNDVVMASEESNQTTAPENVAVNENNPSETINAYADETNRESLNEVITEEKTADTSEAQETDSEFLKPMYNDQVAYWVDYFTTKDKARFERFLANGEKYRHIIEEVFKNHGLPKELFYVGLIESGYYLRARSIAAAVGPWQFMPATGRRYGLIVRPGIDERKSIYKATHAAARYFTDLYNIFGSWELALSAYNAGEYGVIRRITEAKTRDFYELCKMNKLPKETQNYVPKVLAVMKIMEDTKRYDVTINKPEMDIYAQTEDLTLKSSVSLDYVARKLNTNVSTLRVLNPDVTQNVTPYGRSFVLRVPQNGATLDLQDVIAKENPIQQVAKVDYALNRRVMGATHRVRRGENLGLIARKYRTSVARLQQLNGMRGTQIRIGQTLKVRGPTNYAATATNNNRYVVRRGDSLTKIARIKGMTVQKIMQMNNLKRAVIYPGQKLLVSRN